MDDNKDFESFKKIVLITAMVQNLIDVVDHELIQRLLKNQTKRNLNLAVKHLEMDTRKLIKKLYETDDMLFQDIQKAASNNLEYLINTELDKLVNDKREK